MKEDLAQRLARLSPAKQALVVRQLQSRLEALERRQAEPIAIIGVGCRFPGGARDPQSFWTLLRHGYDAITEVPPDRWDWRASSDPEPMASGKINTRWGGFLQQVAHFDARAFGFFPKEAERMDPQQRLLLEVAWEALEDAGLTLERARGSRTGVFIGYSTGDYGRLQLREPERIDALTGSGNAGSMAANRLSYCFDLRGPSMTIDTACSSSLMAVHLACQSIRGGESTVALAGGVNVILLPETHIIFSKAGLIAPDGRCKAFDERADGYSRGEGVGLVVLKPLSQALADADSIYAVIIGSAVNQDGRTNGITAPSRQAQEAVLREAYHNAGVSPGEIQYVETHGTGTALGDLIEAQALGAVLSTDRPKEEDCLIGSVKSNIGHLEAAAGVASLIKTAFALKHKEAPPSLHFRRPNRHIPFDELQLRVAQKLEPWPRGASPARAGVSSFSFGGTNVHVVLEEAPAVEASGPSRAWQLLPLSAKTDSALESASADLADYLKQNPGACLADVAYTLQTGRSLHNHRRLIICQDAVEAANALERLDPESVFTTAGAASDLPLVFMFPGLGDHYPHMAQGLYQTEPAFRAEVDRCCGMLEAEFGLDIRSLIFPEEQRSRMNDQARSFNLRKILHRNGSEAGAGSDELNQTRFAHPAVFVIEYALARLLMKWGLQPQAMIGHSLGEYVAACLAGVFSLEDAIRLVAARALLIEGLPRGAMLAVALSEEESKAYLGPGVWLAATNGPRFCVLSGVEEEIEKVEGKLNEQGVAASRLATRHAFHSEMMREIEAPFRALLNEAQMREPRIPYVSNVTGRWIKEEEARSADYWVEHLCGPVRFGEGVEELLSGSEKVMVEVGPGQSLSSFVKLHPGCKAEQAALVMSSLRSEAEVEADERGLMRLIGKLWMAGAGIDWRGFYEGERRRRVPLPTYPFERQRYWIEPRKAAGELPAMPVVSAEPKAAIADSLYLPVWKDVTENIGPSKDASTEFQTSWLVLLDEEGLGERLVARLRQANQSVTAVARGTAYNRDGADRYTINAGLSADYRALIKSLPSAPDKIIHLWNLEMNDGAGSALEGLESSQERSFHSLLWLAQALGDRHLSRTVELVVVSTQLHAVTGDERICPAKATLLGPCRVIPYEYPQLTCRNVDLWPLPSNGEENERMAERLFTELNRSSAEPAVAYRGARRWVESFEPAQLPLPAPGQVKWREGGVYLVTGGLGGIGLALAEYLAKNWKAKLVLVGRSRLPERAEWPALLASEEEPSDLGRKLSKLLELEAAGIEALALSADVANLEQMEGVIRQARERFGAIHGVIHAAGVMGMGLMQLKSADQANDVLAPKVRGTLVLEQVLSGEPVELTVLCSSVAAVMGGGPGQVDYCGANAFLDAYAERGRLNGPATVSINWGEWLWDAWQAGLEGFSQEIREYFKANRRRYGISFEEGQEALERIVSSGHRRVIVSTREFNRVVEESRVYTAGRMLEQLQESQRQQTIHPRPVLGSDYVEPRNEMERQITEIWQKLLGIEQVGVEDNFFELGGHSLLATQLFSKLRADFQVEISVRNLFEMATVARQAELVATMQWAARGEAPDAFTDAESDLVEGEI